MYPYLDLAKARQREFEQRAAHRRLIDALPRIRPCRRARVASWLRHMFHRPPAAPRPATLCCG